MHRPPNRLFDNMAVVLVGDRNRLDHDALHQNDRALRRDIGPAKHRGVPHDGVAEAIAKLLGLGAKLPRCVACRIRVPPKLNVSFGVRPSLGSGRRDAVAEVEEVV